MTGVTDGIVSGYDGSPGSAAAVRWAAREAKARNTTLTVCLAWAPDHMELPTDSAISDLARLHGKEILARGLPYAQSVLGPGRVHAVLIGRSAAHVLCERSAPPRWSWSAPAGIASCPACGLDRFPGR
jgi:nucleotide-binding universal stress UspA family protein